jgi:23S rRNA pseudouridine1911/1915/1917 synthase
MKLTSRDCIKILRIYKQASDNDSPQKINHITCSNPTAFSELTTFLFNRKQYQVVIDDTLDDDLTSVRALLDQPDTKDITIFDNPLENSKNSLPYKGKACYLALIGSTSHRLDTELKVRYPDMSRNVLQKHIKSGFVTVNGQIAKGGSQQVSSTDEIALRLPDSPVFSDDSLPILYIDDDVIVINKPAGALTHAKGAISTEFSVADFFRRYTTYNVDTNRPGIVHRLDRHTSGVLIGARHADSAVLLQKQFANRTAKKIYYAVVDGAPKHTSATIDLPIKRNPSKPSQFRVESGGKDAITAYELVESTAKHSLIKLSPHTGRTHQLRVHMAYINTPITGDPIYGHKSKNGLMLHAYSLNITLPNGQSQSFSAELPERFNKYFKIKL